MAAEQAVADIQQPQVCGIWEQRVVIRVVYWNSIPSPYLAERFNAVASRGRFDFEVWFNRRTGHDRSWQIDESQWYFRYRYLPSVLAGGHQFNFPTPLFSCDSPDVLISLYADPSFLLGWLVARQRGVRTAFWAQVTYDRWVPRRAWKEQIKHFVFSRVDATFGSGEESRAFAMRYGVPPDRAMTLPHVIDGDHFRSGREVALQSRDALRESLGLRGITFVYVGRLWWGKGLNYLLDAFAVLQRRLDAEISLLLVGDGPDEPELRRQCLTEGIRNVVFAGFRQKPELPHYLTAADVFVFPTLGDPYGLVVDEAMASSLPVLSTSAAGEIRERIEEGVHGFVVPPENSAALLEGMERLAGDGTLRYRMGQAAAARMADSSPERWAADFERGVERILANPTMAGKPR